MLQNYEKKRNPPTFGRWISPVPKFLKNPAPFAPNQQKILKIRKFIQLTVVFSKKLPIFAAQKVYDMTFDKILDNDTLWAVRYENEDT